MKTNIILSFLFITVLCGSAKGQTETVLQDPLPDLELLSTLEKLSSPSAQDTTKNKLVVNVRGDNISQELYKIGTNLKSASGYSGNTAKLLKKIIALTPDERKVPNLIMALSAHANQLSRTNFNFNDGTPLQNKIAYSWGSKQFEIRANPPGAGDECTYAIHGLDCSGFIYQLFFRSGINLPARQCNADTERKVEFLTRYLKPYFGESKFEVKDLGPLKAKEMQSGDIIYFSNSAGAVVHIAIVLLDEQGKVTLYQSMGNPSRSKNNQIWCTRNISQSYGVIAKVLDSSIENGRTYSCVRIKSI